MEIEVSQEKLAKALNIVSKITTGSKITLPILNNVLLRVDNNKVTLTTTNLDIAIVDFLPVSKCNNGVITIPAKLLADFVSNLPKGEIVKISTKDTKVLISSNKYNSTFNGIIADDFPELPEINESEANIIKLNIDEFKNSVGQVMVATSNDLTRPTLTGIYFNLNEGDFCIAATDGYRLAEKILIKNFDKNIKSIVPASTIQEVMRVVDNEIEEIEISFSNDLVRFRLGEVEIISKVINGSFPEYRKLIPKDNTINIELNKDELLRVTKLAALFAKESDGSIVCEAKKENGFSVKSTVNEFGESNSYIDAKIENEGKINLNSRFLLDALNNLEEENIIFSFSEKITPILLKNKTNDKYTHIIMPLDK